MSALECIAKAEHCEDMAKSVYDRADRRMLLTAASQWRTLAKAAEADGADSAPPTPAVAAP